MYGSDQLVAISVVLHNKGKGIKGMGLVLNGILSLSVIGNLAILKVLPDGDETGGEV